MTQAGETDAHYVTATDGLEYLPSRDGITFLSIDSCQLCETQLNHLYCLCTAGDICRKSFTKKEDETADDEEQHNYDHGHDNDHGEQDEEYDDQLDD